MNLSPAPDTQSPDTQTVTVVGAGIVGICTALFLQERGYQVELIDRLPPAKACSFGNAGVLGSWSVVPESMPGQLKKIPGWLIDPKGPVFIRPRYIAAMIPWLIRFLREGDDTRVARIADAMKAINNPVVDLYRHLLADTGHDDLIRDSAYVHIYRDAANAKPERKPWQLRAERGARIEYLDGPALRRIEPAVSEQFKAAVLVHDQGHTINPGRLGEVLADKVQRQGGLITQAEVTDVVALDSGAFELRVNGDARTVEKLVITAGAWSTKLTRKLGCNMPLEAERGYHAVLPDPGVELTNVLNDGERHIAITSMEMGLRVAGTVEFAGVDAKPDYRRAETLVGLAKAALPDLNTDNPDYWMGPRPAFPDTIPVVSPLPKHPNAFVSCGHSHLGLTGAPMSGRLLAAMIDGDRPDTDLEPFRADRF